MVTQQQVIQVEQQLTSQQKQFTQAKKQLQAQKLQFTRQQRQLPRQQRRLLQSRFKQQKQQSLQALRKQEQAFQKEIAPVQSQLETAKAGLRLQQEYEYGRKMARRGVVDPDFTKMMQRGYRGELSRIEYGTALIEQRAALKGLGGFQTITGEIQYRRPSGEVVFYKPAPIAFSPSTIAPTTEAMPRIESAGTAKERLMRAIQDVTFYPQREMRIPKKPPTFKDISWQETFGKTTPAGKRVDIPGKISLGQYVWGKYSQAVGKVVGYRDEPRVGKPPIFQISPKARGVIETTGRIIPDVSKWIAFTPLMATTPAALQQIISRGAKPVGETIFVSKVKKIPKGFEIKTAARTDIGGARFVGRTDAKLISVGKKLQISAGRGWVRQPPRMDLTQIEVAGVVERLGKAKEIFVRPTYQVTKEAGRGFRGIVGIKEVVRKELYAPRVITTRLGKITEQPFLGVSQRLREGVFKLRGTAQPLFTRGKGVISDAEIKGILAYVGKAPDTGRKITTFAKAGKPLIKTVTPQVQKQITQTAFGQATGLGAAATQIVTKEATKGAVVAGVLPTGFGAVRSMIRTQPAVRQFPAVQPPTYFPLQIQPQVPIVATIPKVGQAIEQAFGLTQKQQLRQRQLLEQETTLLQLPTQKIVTRQLIVPSFRLGVRQEFRVPQPFIRPTRLVVPPLIPKVSATEITPFGAGRIPEGVKGFRVFVKRKGKRVFFTGRFPRGEAIRIGAREARRTLRATFGVVEAGVIRGRRAPAFTPSPEVFRTYRIVKGKRVPLKDVWIQKAPYRLSAKGEVREIITAKKRKGGKRTRWL
ncbi:hypothetical protein CMI37_31255 [Candidatus Pacearchaeota archaeon]|nr:hypothetical protein [Candidatus Pacearchaeota archaeon]